jgi:hypothetical protein
MRKAIVAAFLLALFASSVPAQGWAEKMFKDGLTHDFGVVPHGAQLFHRFTVTNIYAVRMEITGLHSGCGCVTVIAAKRVLEPRETTTIDVSMDARRFTGSKTVAVRVTVGPEFTSSAELRVSAQSRGDIVFNPGEVNFGQVTGGVAPTQTVDVEYAGSLAWEVKDVVVPKELPVEVASKDLYRRPGQVGYRLTVTLKKEAPAGALKDFIHLKTNDPNAPLVPLLVEANVLAALSVTPSVLNLGTVKPGDALTRRVVLRGARPFRVTKVDGIDDAVQLGTPLATTSVTVQTVTFRCLFDKPGDFKRELQVRTDLQDAPVTVTIEGTVAP